MSKRGRLRLDSSVALVPLCISIVALLVMGASALAGERVGFLDERGAFVEKAEISTKGSVIVVRKLKPDETFDSLSLRFVFPGAQKQGAAKGLFIQWEKQPGHMGQRWPLDVHRRFDGKSATLNASWVQSLAFALLDQSGKRLFAGQPWDRILEIRLEGRLLQRKPSTETARSKMTAQADEVHPEKQAPVAPEPAPPLPVPAIPAPQEPAARPEAAPAPPQVTSEKTDTSSDSSFDEILQRQEDLRKELDKLTRRVSDVEHAVMLAQRWFYWGPLLALTLSILFSSVALFLTFIRLSRTRNRLTIPPSRYGKVHLSSQDRFRRMG